MAYSKTTKLIMKHLSFEKTDLGFASVKYFAETGQISGELYGRIKDMVDEALAENLDARRSALPISHVSKQRELLIAFMWYLKQRDIVITNTDNIEVRVNLFLKSNL